MNKLIVANYKMNGNADFYKKVSQKVNSLKLKDTVVLCPPFVYIPFMKMKNKSLFLGCQDIANEQSTKATGQTAAYMLKEFGVSYAIVGHSERRAVYENNEQVANKVGICISNGIVPIVCVGEASQTSKLDVLIEQVKSAVSKAGKGEIVFAYEPIWAIGSGVVPTIEKINYAIDMIKSTLNELGLECKVLYGGSVNVANYKLLLTSNADGFLLGGVSNKLDDFISILKGE